MLELETQLKVVGSVGREFSEALRSMRRVSANLDKAADALSRSSRKSARSMQKAQRSSDKIRSNAKSTAHHLSKGALEMGRMGDLFARSVTRIRYAGMAALGGGAAAGALGYGVGLTLKENDQYLQRNIGLASSVQSAFGGTFDERFAQAPGLSRELGIRAAATPGTEAEFSTAFAGLAQVFEGTGKDIATYTQQALIAGQLSRGKDGRNFIVRDIVDALTEGNINKAQMTDLVFLMRSKNGRNFEKQFDDATPKEQRQQMIDALGLMASRSEELKKSFEVQLTTVQSILQTVFLEATKPFSGKATGAMAGAASTLQENFPGLMAAAGPLGQTGAALAPVVGGLALLAGMMATVSMGVITLVAALGALAGAVAYVGIPLSIALVALTATIALATLPLVALGAAMYTAFVEVGQHSEMTLVRLQGAFESFVYNLNEATRGIGEVAQAFYNLTKPLLLMVGGGLWDALIFSLETVTPLIKMFTGALEILAGTLMALTASTRGSKISREDRLMGAVKSGNSLWGLWEGYKNVKEMKAQIIDGFDSPEAQAMVNKGARRILSAYEPDTFKRGDSKTLLDRLLKYFEDSKTNNNTNITGDIFVEVRAETLEDPQRAALVVEDILTEIAERPTSANGSAFRGGRG